MLSLSYVIDQVKEVINEMVYQTIRIRDSHNAN